MNFLSLMKIRSGSAVSALAWVPFVLLASVQASAQNEVTDWNAIAITQARASTAPGASTPGGTNIYVAYVQLSVYNAVVAIQGGYQPYEYTVSAPPARRRMRLPSRLLTEPFSIYFPTALLLSPLPITLRWREYPTEPPNWTANPLALILPTVSLHCEPAMDAASLGRTAFPRFRNLESGS